MATINSFFASPTTVTIPEYASYTTAMSAQQAYGTPTRLHWSVSDYATITLGSNHTTQVADVTFQTAVEVDPSVDTIYTLTATGGSGTVTATVTVTVSNPASTGGGGTPVLAITSFTATPSGVTPTNNGSQLSWTATGIAPAPSANIGAFSSSVTIPTGVAASNSATGGWVLAGSYFYWVTTFDSAGTESKKSTSDSITVTGNTNKVTVSWTAVTGATKYRVYRGASSFASQGTYSEVTGTSFVDYGATMILDDNAGTVLDVSWSNGSGATSESPTVTTTYTLKARDTANNIVSANATVTVSGTALPVIESFTADSTSLAAGQTTTLRWKVDYFNSIIIDNGGGSYTAYYQNMVTVSPNVTTTYTLTATNSAGSVTSSVTVSVTGSGAPTPSLTSPGIESHHPYQNAVYNFNLPGWPGGTQTAYLTFSLDTYVDDFGSVFTVSSNLESFTFSDIQYAGYTLVIQSSDGKLAVDTSHGVGSREYYGFRILTVSYTPPASSDYMIGNPNSQDYPNILVGSMEPNAIFQDTDASGPLRLCPAMTGYAYSYQFRLPNGTSSTFSVTSGTLPPGLSMASTGLVSGTPTAPSSGPFTIQATSASPAISVSRAFVIPVYAPPVQIGATVSPATPSLDTPRIVYYAEDLAAAFNGYKYAFHKGTKRYCMLSGSEYYGSAGSARRITAFTSTDDGFTWTEIPNKPPIPPLPIALAVGITRGVGDGATATYTYAYGPSPADSLHVGDWLQIDGFTAIVAFNGLYQITALGATTFSVNNTGVGTETTVFNGSNSASATRQQISTYPCKEYPVSFTDNNSLTQTGMLGILQYGAPFVYYDGADAVYAITTLVGSTGISSWWAGKDNAAHPINQINYFIWKLDLTTDTWTCLTPSSYFYAFTVSTNANASAFVQLSTGHFRLFFYASPHNDGTVYNTTNGLYFTDYNPSTDTWSAAVQLTSDIPLFQTNGFINSGSSADIVTAAHQTHSFVDGATLDVTHAVLNGLTEVYGSGNNPGFRFTIKYIQVNSSGIVYSYFPTNIIYSIGNGVLVPNTNEYVVSALVHDHFDFHASQVYSAPEPAVLRFKLSAPAAPTFTEEPVYRWNARMDRFDSMVIGASFQYMYVGLDAAGNLYYFASGMTGIEEGDSADTVYLMTNTPAGDGSTDKTWTPMVDLYSVVWAPYQYIIENQDEGSFAAAYALSVESNSDNSFYYVNFDGQDVNGQYVNMTVVMAQAAPQVTGTAFMFSRMSNLHLAFPSTSPGGYIT